MNNGLDNLSRTFKTTSISKRYLFEYQTMFTYEKYVSPANLEFVFDRSYQQSGPLALVDNFHSKNGLSFDFEFEYAVERFREFLIFYSKIHRNSFKKLLSLQKMLRNYRKLKKCSSETMKLIIEFL